jgi:hypothetical protein
LLKSEIVRSTNPYSQSAIVAALCAKLIIELRLDGDMARYEEGVAHIHLWQEIIKSVSMAEVEPGTYVYAILLNVVP